MDGEDITGLPIHKRGTVIVFQDMRLFPHMTVEENVAFPLKMQGVSRSGRLEQARDLLEKVQMGGFGTGGPRSFPADSSSGPPLPGALAARPRLLLLDEPFSALDENLREDMRNLVLQLQREFHMTVILVTHDRGGGPVHVRPDRPDVFRPSGPDRDAKGGIPPAGKQTGSRLFRGLRVYKRNHFRGRFTGGGLDCPVPFLSQEFISQAIPPLLILQCLVRLFPMAPAG